MLRAVLLALVVLLTACSPTSTTPPPGTPADPTTASARPRDIDISGVLPCELLTPAQRAELGLDGEPRLTTDTDALFGEARSCSILGLEPGRGLRFSLSLVTEYGIERFSEPGISAGVEEIDVAGFPAVLSPPPPSTPTNCLVAVDVFPGQMVGVLLSDGGSGDPGVTLDELCREVPRYADAVMVTLSER